MLREQRRLELMLRQQDSQLLLLKELEERQYQLLHRQQEMAESQQYRETPEQLLPPEPLLPPDYQQQLVGLMQEESRRVQRMAELLERPLPPGLGPSLTIPSVTPSES